MSGVHRLCDQGLFMWPSQERNQDRVAGAPGLPMAPRLQAEEKLKSQFVGPSPYSHRPQVTPGCSLAPRGEALSDLPSSVLSWASLWRCQVPTPVFPA